MPSRKRSQSSGPHHRHPKICKKALYSSFYNVVPTACLFTVLPKEHFQEPACIAPTTSEYSENICPNVPRVSVMESELLPPSLISEFENDIVSINSPVLVQTGNCRQLPSPMTCFYSEEYRCMDSQSVYKQQNMFSDPCLFRTKTVITLRKKHDFRENHQIGTSREKDV